MGGKNKQAQDRKLLALGGREGGRKGSCEGLQPAKAVLRPGHCSTTHCQRACGGCWAGAPYLVGINSWTNRTTFINSFNKYSLSTYCVSDLVLSAGIKDE